jgi:hypothetical protein
LKKTIAAIRVPQSVDHPQEPTGWIGSNSLIALKFHRIRYRLRKPSGKGGHLDRGPSLERKQFPDRNGYPRQGQSRDILDLEKILTPEDGTGSEAIP